MIADLRTLRTAERLSAEANQVLADLLKLQRDVLSEMVALANTRLRGQLPDELYWKLDIDCLRIGAEAGLAKAMEKVVLPAQEHADFMAHKLHILECRSFDERMGIGVGRQYQMEDAAE